MRKSFEGLNYSYQSEKLESRLDKSLNKREAKNSLVIEKQEVKHAKSVWESKKHLVTTIK